MVQTCKCLEWIRLGFRPHHALRSSMTVPETKYLGATQITEFFDWALGSISAVRGVESAAVVAGQPMVDRTADLTSRAFTNEGHPSQDASGTESADFRIFQGGEKIQANPLRSRLSS
jgi:hypothetical protein